MTMIIKMKMFDHVKIFDLFLWQFKISKCFFCKRNAAIVSFCKFKCSL